MRKTVYFHDLKYVDIVEEVRAGFERRNESTFYIPMLCPTPLATIL